MDKLPKETLTLEQVQQRVPLLKRVVRDAAAVHESRKKSKDFLDELLVISKKFSSPEISETISRLRRDIAQDDRDLDTFRNEVRSLGGVLRDEEQGLTYFAAEFDDREIYLIWELDEPDLISWHGREQTLSDRVPMEFPEGSQAPG